MDIFKFALETGLTLDIRVVTLDDQPWFLATDVCSALGYVVSASGVNHYLVGLGEGIDRKTLNARTLGVFEGIRGNPMRCFISEAGLYRLVMRAQSERPEVARFQEWVTREVLPAIRKDGAYVMGEEKVRTGEMISLSFSMDNSGASWGNGAITACYPTEPIFLHL